MKLVIARSFDHFYWWVEHNRLNPRNYRYAHLAVDVRGTPRSVPILALAGHDPRLASCMIECGYQVVPQPETLSDSDRVREMETP
jgi:hypothetical protein